MQTKFLERFIAFTPLSFRLKTKGLMHQTIRDHKHICCHSFEWNSVTRVKITQNESLWKEDGEWIILRPKGSRK
jgi:hypothetical protein